jgi:hypothetical protein
MRRKGVNLLAQLCDLRLVEDVSFIFLINAVVIKENNPAQPKLVGEVVHPSSGGRESPA